MSERKIVSLLSIVKGKKPHRDRAAAGASDFDLTRDGRVLVVQAPDPSTGPGRLNVVVNWFEEIKKR
jgi:hypothetical protein